jgi:protein SCO1/2
MRSTSRRACLVLAALGLLGLGGCDSSKAGFTGTDITGAPFAKGFELPDGDGKVWRLSDFAGKAVVVFFGYSQCPDVCPTTMAELAQAKQLLGKDGERVQGVFITVDPERDTPEVVKAYAAAFDPGFVGLRPASDEQLRQVAKDFKVVYGKDAGGTPQSYTVSHTAASFVFDPQGRVRLYEPYNIGAKALAGDLAQLLK